MLPKYVDVTEKTGHQVKGPVTSWQTKNGNYNVEHLAGITPLNDLMVFWWSPAHDWQAVSVSAKTGKKIKSSVTSWQTKNGIYNVEHLAGITLQNELITFWWSPQHDWQSINISTITGQRIVTPVTSWQTRNGQYNVEHLAGVNAQGDVLVFWWSPAHDWQYVNVSAITNRKMSGQLTSWQTRNGQFNVEHLAGISPDNNLITFWWSPQHDWQAIDVSRITGSKIASPVISWQTRSGTYNVEHLAGTDPDGNLITSWWSPAHDWQSVNGSRIAGKKSSLNPTVYQVIETNGNAEVLNIMGPSNELLHFYWKPSFDWQAIDLSSILNKKIFSFPESWLTASGATIVEHIAAEGADNHLLVFWFDKEIRTVLENEGQFTHTWKNIGPANFTCVVRSLAVDPVNENIVYAGTPFGGVWKSTDMGKRWMPTMDALENTQVDVVSLCGGNPGILYAAMKGSASNICRSNNRGGQWRNVSDYIGTECRAIAVHPGNADIVYVGSDRSLNKSINGGNTWLVNNVVLNGEPKTNSNGIFDGNLDDVKVDPVNPDTLYIAVRSRGIFKSRDAGNSWITLGSNVSFEVKNDQGELETTSLNGSFRTLLAIGEDSRPGKSGTQFIVAKVQGTVIVSRNGGTTWRVLPGTDHGDSRQSWWCSAIAVCPVNEDFIVAGGLKVQVTKNAAAQNPEWVNLDSLHADQQSIVFSLSNAQNFYFANDGFVGKCTDNGSVVSNISMGLVASQGFDTDVSQTVPLVAGTATYHTGILRTGRQKLSEWEYMKGNEGGFIAIDPLNENTMFCCAWSDKNLRKTVNGGTDWSEENLKAIDNNGDLVDTHIGILSFRPDNPQRVFASGFYGHVHYSTDNGEHWDYVKMPDGSPFLPDGANGRNNRIKALEFCPGNGEFIYLSTTSGNLWLTSNGGLSASAWKQINTPVSAEIPIIAIAVHPTNPKALIIGYDSENTNNVWSGVQLANGRYNWTNISASGTGNSLPSTPVYSLVFDPLHLNRIFAATKNGVYITESTGVSWRQYNESLPSIYISKLVLRRRSRVLYASAYGRGVYRRWIGR